MMKYTKKFYFWKDFFIGKLERNLYLDLNTEG